MSPEAIADANPGLGSDLTDGGVAVFGRASRLPPPYRRSFLLRLALDGRGIRACYPLRRGLLSRFRWWETRLTRRVVVRGLHPPRVNRP